MATRKELQTISKAYFEEAQTKQRKQRIHDFVDALTKHIIHCAETGKTSIHLNFAPIYPTHHIASYIEIPFYISDEIIIGLKNNFPDVDFTIEKISLYEQLRVCWE